MDTIPQETNLKQSIKLPNEIHILVAEQLCEVRDVISFLLTNRYLSSLLLRPLHSLAARSSCILTALIWAVVKKDSQMLRVLLSHGPRGITLKTKTGAVLHYVSRRCTDETVEKVMNEGVNLIVTKRTGSRKTISGTTLHWAARIGHGVLLQLLLDSDANVAAFDAIGHTALHWAASMGNNAAIKLLLSYGSVRLVRGIFGDTPLDRARYYNHQETVMLLITDTPVDYVYRDHSTSVTLVASCSNDDTAYEAVTSLIARGSRFCYHEGYGSGPSALLNAVIANNPKTMSLLLSAGEGTIQWPGRLPIYKIALKAGHPELAYKLITTAPPSFCDTHGQTLLHMALTLPECDTKLIESLCLKGVSVNSPSEEYDTPLLKAVSLKNHSFVSLLLSYGAEVNAIAIDDKTALHYAAQGPADRWTLHPPAANYEVIDIAKALILAGANVNAQDDVGLTPLHEAVLGGSEAMVELLLEAGADPTLKDYNWQTPLDLAARLMDAGQEEADIWGLLTCAKVGYKSKPCDLDQVEVSDNLKEQW